MTDVSEGIEVVKLGFVSVVEDNFVDSTLLCI